jgi:hypothetical protein
MDVYHTGHRPALDEMVTLSIATLNTSGSSLEPMFYFYE